MAATNSSAPASASADGPQLEFEGVHRTEGRFPVPDLEVVDTREVDADKSFFYQCWTPAEASHTSFASRPVVILAHGLGGHSGHLSVVAEYFSRRLGMRVYAYDTLGHGRSPGRRGHADSWTELRVVLAHFLRFVLQVCETDPQRQLVLFGNSLGGAVCIEYMQRYADATTDEAAAANVCALVVNAPGLSMQGVGWMAKGAVRLLSVLTPRYQIDVGLDSTHLSNDPAKQRENDLDPLVHSLATPALFNDWWEILHYVSNHADRIRVPFLMMQGAADKIVVPEENRHFFDKVARTNDKAEFQLLPGGEHESFNDMNRSEVVAMYGDFLQRHHII